MSFITTPPVGAYRPSQARALLPLPCRGPFSTTPTEGGPLMGHARKRRRQRQRAADWLRDALGPALRLLAVSLVAAYLSSVGIAPVSGECLAGGTQPRVVAVARDHALKMPESEGSNDSRASSAPRLARANVVGRDGIEPPTLRFSAARSTD